MKTTKTIKIIYIFICCGFFVFNLIYSYRSVEAAAYNLIMTLILVPFEIICAIGFYNQEFSIRILFMFKLKDVTLEDVSEFYLVMERIGVTLSLMLGAWMPIIILSK